MDGYITADMAREMAFKKVNTTYEDCFNTFMEVVFKCVEKEAQKGQLSMSLTFETLVDQYFKGVKSDYLCATLKEILKETLSAYGFNVQYIRTNYSSYTTMEISW
jgi:hypothetical protein